MAGINTSNTTSSALSTPLIEVAETTPVKFKTHDAPFVAWVKIDVIRETRAREIRRFNDNAT